MSAGDHAHERGLRGARRVERGTTAIEEAHRVLKPGGLLWIAEVRSRFDGKNGTASVASFVAALAALGFKRKRDVDERNTMFFTAEFIKTWVSKGKHSNTSTHRAVRWPPLKACTYKRR